MKRNHRKKIIDTYRLPAGWTNNLQQILKKHSECTISFKRADVKKTGEISVAGICLDCEAEIRILFKNNREILKYYSTEEKKPHTYMKKRRTNFQVKDNLIEQ